MCKIYEAPKLFPQVNSYNVIVPLKSRCGNVLIHYHLLRNVFIIKLMFAEYWAINLYICVTIVQRTGNREVFIRVCKMFKSVKRSIFPFLCMSTCFNYDCWIAKSLIIYTLYRYIHNVAKPSQQEIQNQLPSDCLLHTPISKLFFPFGMNKLKKIIEQFINR